MSNTMRKSKDKVEMKKQSAQNASASQDFPKGIGPLELDPAVLARLDAARGKQNLKELVNFLLRLHISLADEMPVPVGKKRGGGFEEECMALIMDMYEELVCKAKFKEVVPKLMGLEFLVQHHPGGGDGLSAIRSMIAGISVLNHLGDDAQDLESFESKLAREWKINGVEKRVYMKIVYDAAEYYQNIVQELRFDDGVHVLGRLSEKLETIPKYFRKAQAIQGVIEGHKWMIGAED